MQSVKDGGPHSPNLLDLICKRFGPAQSPTQAPVMQRVPWMLCPGKKRLVRDADCLAHPVLRLRMNAVINLLVPHTSSWLSEG
jgi:hypothetical protein